METRAERDEREKRECTHSIRHRFTQVCMNCGHQPPLPCQNEFGPCVVHCGKCTEPLRHQHFSPPPASVPKTNERQFTEGQFIDTLNFASKMPPAWRRSLYEKIGIAMRVRGEVFDATTAPKGEARATPPATPAPEASGEAGERLAEIERHLNSAYAPIFMPNTPAAEMESHARWLHQQLTASRAALEDAFQEAARLQQELAEARAGGWVSVGERLPEDHGHFDFATKDKIYYSGWFGSSLYGEGDWYPRQEDDEYPFYQSVSEVTHWRAIRKEANPNSPAPAQTPPPATPEAREAGGEEGGRAV